MERGGNVILDSVAGESFARNFELVAPLGQILWFGMAGGIPPEFLGTWAGHFVRGIAVQTFHLTYSIAEPYPDLLGASIETILGFLTEGKIDPVIYDRIPLREVARAHDLVHSRATVGKVVLKP